MCVCTRHVDYDGEEGGGLRIPNQARLVSLEENPRHWGR